MSLDTTELVCSPKGSCAPEQGIFGNCILMSSSKIILRNIIVILHNGLKTESFSKKEQKFIKDKLNYKECNKFINEVINSDFLHQCLYRTCDYVFLNEYITENLNPECLDMLLIFIFIYYFLWDLSKDILKSDKTLKDIVEGDIESKEDLQVSANVINKAFTILFINHESFEETMRQNFTTNSDVSKLYNGNPDMSSVISRLFDILSKTPRCILYKLDFSPYEDVFKIKFTIDKTDHYSNISIENLIKLLNISSKQKFYTSMGIDIELLDEFSDSPEENCGGHALYIQNIEGYISHIRNSWGINKSSIIQNICKLLSNFIIRYNRHKITFDGMFLLDEESQALLDNIFANDSGITKETTLMEANYLLLSLEPPTKKRKYTSKGVKGGSKSKHRKRKTIKRKKKNIKTSKRNTF